MRLVSKTEFDLTPPPSTRDVQAWRENPVTERFLNIVYRLTSAAPSAKTRLGFIDCREQILDLVNDISSVLQPPPKPVTDEGPDYGGAEIFQKRQEQLSVNP